MLKKNNLSALIGLAGALQSNDKTENTDRIILQALAADDSEEEAEKVRREKFRISPGCETCPTPCGNTSDFDFDEFRIHDPEAVPLKIQVMEKLQEQGEKLQNKGETDLPPVFVKALNLVRFDLYPDRYEELLKELS